MAISDRRWEYAWMLLSLDLTRAFWRDRWRFVPESLDAQSGIRQRLDAALNDKIDYVTNYGAIHDRLADWFTTTFGQNQFDNAMAVAAALEGGIVNSFYRFGARVVNDWWHGA